MMPMYGWQVLASTSPETPHYPPVAIFAGRRNKGSRNKGNKKGNKGPNTNKVK
jgi:hypothetical protein